MLMRLHISRRFSTTPSKILEALSPLDGRYKHSVESLYGYFSEKAFVKFRIKTEVEWLKTLARKGVMPLSNNLCLDSFNNSLDGIYKVENYFEKVKEIEKVTNHDIKAVEYFIKAYLEERSDLSKYSEFVHFTCTSEDINNISYALMLSGARENVMNKEYSRLYSLMAEMASRFKDNRMIGRTHGQSATPTTMGKEFANF